MSIPHCSQSLRSHHVRCQHQSVSQCIYSFIIRLKRPCIRHFCNARTAKHRIQSLCSQDIRVLPISCTAKCMVHAACCLQGPLSSSTCSSRSQSPTPNHSTRARHTRRRGRSPPFQRCALCFPLQASLHVFAHCVIPKDPECATYLPMQCL